MDNEVKREIILENYERPFHKDDSNVEGYKKINANNPTCIDNIDIYILYDNNIIKDIKFMGEACAISTSSTSIMLKNLIGKTLEDAYTYVKNFSSMCSEDEYDEELLDEGIVFSEIYKQNNRKNCVMLPYKALLKELEELMKK